MAANNAMICPRMGRKRLIGLRAFRRAKTLRAEIEEWATQFQSAGLRRGNVTGEEMKWYEYYLNRAD